jgi:hypothetical protein
MAYYTIPTSTTEARYKQLVSIDGVDYTLQFDWNQREGKWYLRVLINDEILVSGVKIVVNYSLLDKFKDTRMPSGILMALDSIGEDDDPGLTDLGNRVKLTYITSDELAA